VTSEREGKDQEVPECMSEEKKILLCKRGKEGDLTGQTG
jgi:hypothetical protein